MNQREKILAALTGAAIVIGGGYMLIGGGDQGATTTGGGVSVSANDLERAQRDFESMIEQVRHAPEVRRQFLELVGQDTSHSLGAERFAQRPDLAFPTQVAEWAAQVGFRAPRIGNRTEDIHRPGTRDLIEQYQLIIVTVDIAEGDLPRIAELLKVFEQRGLIIQEVRMNGYLDSSRVSASITVARLVESFHETRERARLRRERGG